MMLVNTVGFCLAARFFGTKNIGKLRSNMNMQLLLGRCVSWMTFVRTCVYD